MVTATTTRGDHRVYRGALRSIVSFDRSSDMSDVIEPKSKDDPRDWFIAIGNHFNWGRAKNADTAIRNMRRQVSDKRTNEWTLYSVHESSSVNGMGGISWYSAGPEPVIVKKRRLNKTTTF